jgi:predicted aspartyl protease
MRIIGKALCASMLAASLAGFVSTPAIAQGAGINFRVVAGDRNPSACQQFDAALSRVHTFTPAGDTATLRTAGGVTSNMKQTTPGVFTTTLGIGGTNFNVVADTSKSPKALDVTEPRLGCRWNAVAP